MTLATVAKSAVSTVKQNSPAVLTGFGVAGVLSTAIFAARAHVKAEQMALEARGEHGDSFPAWSLKERLRYTWTLYIPAAAIGTVTIASIIGSQSINARRQAALIGAFSITEGAFQEYREQVTEALGKTKEKSVRDKIVQKQVDDNPPSELYIIDGGNVLCLDTYTGRYFSSTMEKIRGAQNDFNELLDGTVYLSANEFYHYLGLESVVVGEQVGFSPENRLNVEFSTALSPDGRPCLAISFRALPRQDYMSMFQ